VQKEDDHYINKYRYVITGQKAAFVNAMNTQEPKVLSVLLQKIDRYVDVCTQINQCVNTGQKAALENAMDVQEQKIKDFLQACGGSGEVRVYMYVCIYIYTHIYEYTYIYIYMYNISSVRISHRKKKWKTCCEQAVALGRYVYTYIHVSTYTCIYDMFMSPVRPSRRQK